ncbi:MAG: hypothetical protein WBQ25_16515 [Nitrososphaeraceae archaeon]
MARGIVDKSEYRIDENEFIYLDQLHREAAPCVNGYIINIKNAFDHQ